MQQAAQGATTDADRETDPRTELQRTPRTEPHTKNHHAFEADVHDARTFGEKATESS